MPTLPLDQDDCKKFAAAVEDRFNNPFVNHELMSISLNSTSKWRARNMPSFLEYIEKNGKLPAVPDHELRCLHCLLQQRCPGL